MTASKEHLLDTLGCAIGAYDCDTAEIGRALAGPAARNELAGRIVGSREPAAAGMTGPEAPFTGRHGLVELISGPIELRKQVSPDHLAGVEVQTYWSAWHESGSEPAKWDPTTRETADHSLPHILAWTLRHGVIDHRAFVPESYRDPSIRPLIISYQLTVDKFGEESQRKDSFQQVTIPGNQPLEATRSLWRSWPR